MSEIEPTVKINLRSKKRDILTKIGKSLSIIPPTKPNTSSSSDNLNILWLSPDEWLIYSNHTEYNNYKIEDELYNVISKLNYGSVTKKILFAAMFQICCAAPKKISAAEHQQLSLLTQKDYGELVGWLQIFDNRENYNG